MSKSLRVLAACIVAGVMVVASPGASSAASGFHTASKAEAKRLLNALITAAPEHWKTTPVECIDAQQSNSSRNWFVVTMFTESPSGRDCTRWFRESQGLYVIKKNGKAVGVVGNGILSMTMCSRMAEQIKAHKGPRSVYRDVKAADYCTPD